MANVSGVNELKSDEVCVKCETVADRCPGEACRRRTDFMAGALAVRDALKPWRGDIKEDLEPPAPGGYSFHVVSMHRVLEELLPMGDCWHERFRFPNAGDNWRPTCLACGYGIPEGFDGPTTPHPRLQRESEGGQ